MVASALRVLSFPVLVVELPADLVKANTLRKRGETLALAPCPYQTLLAVEGEELAEQSAAPPVPNTTRQIIIHVRHCQVLAMQMATLPLAGMEPK
ncbi:MAG: hypothetical protein IPJ71_01535 [Bdellovibrionales bacterium]|nr:hypothetical protein [Bdellovibrionales bacterium]